MDVWKGVTLYCKQLRQWTSNLIFDEYTPEKSPLVIAYGKAGCEEQAQNYH